MMLIDLTNKIIILSTFVFLYHIKNPFILIPTFVYQLTYHALLCDCLCRFLIIFLQNEKLPSIYFHYRWWIRLEEEIQFFMMGICMRYVFFIYLKKENYDSMYMYVLIISISLCLSFIKYRPYGKFKEKRVVEPYKILVN